MHEPEIGGPKSESPVYDEAGVDLTLIRDMLAKTPAERLVYMESVVNSMAELQANTRRSSMRGNEPMEEREVYGAEPGLPVYDEAGVDLTLIRDMLAMSPAERLRAAERAAATAYELVEFGRKFRARAAGTL